MTQLSSGSRYRKRHKKEGLCVRCTKKVMKGYVVCKYHRDMNRENINRRNKIKRGKRNKA